MSDMNREAGEPAVPADQVTELLGRSAAGDRGAFDRLINLVYDDLRGVAHRRLATRDPGQTLDTTALVHETYLRLLPHADTSWGDRAHFFALASRAMRHVLIDYSRYRGADKRQGGIRIPLREDSASTDPRDVDLVELTDALRRLGERDPRLERLVECRFFGGMTVEETARALGVSGSTIDRDWVRAKTYLYSDLMGQDEG